MVWKGKCHRSKVLFYLHMCMSTAVSILTVCIIGRRVVPHEPYENIASTTNTKQKIVCLFLTRFVPPLPSLSFSTRLQREKCRYTQDPDQHYS